MRRADLSGVTTRRALVAVAVGVCLSTVAACSSGGDSATASPSRPASGSASTSAAAPGPADSPGAGPAAITANDLGLVSELSWKPWHDTRLPFSDTFGPAHVDGQAATGFSHDSVGALVAMMQQQMRLSVVSDQDWPDLARASAVTEGTDTAPGERVSSGLSGPQIHGIPFYDGFKWVSFSPTTAVADLAVQSLDGTLANTRVTETWIDGDWKIVLPRGGAADASQLGGLDGYQPWPGVPR